MQLKETTTTGQGVTKFVAETSKYRLTLREDNTGSAVTIEDLVSGKSNTVNPPSLEAASDLYNSVKNVIASVGE